MGTDKILNFKKSGKDLISINKLFMMPTTQNY